MRTELFFYFLSISGNQFNYSVIVYVDQSQNLTWFGVIYLRIQMLMDQNKNNKMEIFS